MTMKRIYTRTALCLAVSLSINGCAVYGDKREVDERAGKTMDSASQRIGHDLRKVTLEQKLANQEVDLPFLASQPRPISRDAELPPVLQGKVNITSVFGNGGEADLQTVAKRIQEASGILVEVTPDALMPLTAFGPRLTESKSAQVAATAADWASQTVSANTDTLNLDDRIVPNGAESVLVSTPAIQAYAYSAPAQRVPALKPGQQKLSAVLDQVTVPLGLYWRPENNGHKIVIYRTETRVFEIRGAETKVVGDVELNMTGSMGETTNNAIDSKSKNKVELPSTDGPQIADIKKHVQQFMTRAGSIAEASGNMIIVTDTKDALDRIQQYVDVENKSRSRYVELVLQEITVENIQSSQGGMNWNLQFNPTGEGNQATVDGLNSLLEQQGAAASLGLGVARGPWAGSSVAVQALSQLSKVVSVISDTAGGPSGSMLTLGEPLDREYVNKLQQTAATSDTSRPTVSAQQNVVSWGRVISILPFAYSNGDARLTVKFDNKAAPVFRRHTFPDGSFVESSATKSDVMARTALVRSGQPYVLRATVRNQDDFNETRTDRNAPVLLGGSDIANKNQRITLLVVTAMVKER